MAGYDLMERAGELRRQLVEYGESDLFADEWEAFLDENLDKKERKNRAAYVNVFDRFLYQAPLFDGGTVLDEFLEEAEDLSDVDREILSGWRNVIESLFEIENREGDTLRAMDLINDLVYRIRPNMGPEFLDQIPVGGFIHARILPVGDEWMFSGTVGSYPTAARAQVYSHAMDLAMRSPEHVFRNKERLAEGWKHQAEDYREFTTFFGSNMVVLPLKEFGKRLKEYARWKSFESRSPNDGMTRAERAARLNQQIPPLPDEPAPDWDVEVATIGLFYDPIEGLNYLPDLGYVVEAFEKPELAKQNPHRMAIRMYLESEDISPTVLRRLAEKDTKKATEVFRNATGTRSFDWDRDGEQLLLDDKPDWAERKHLPGIIPISDRLTQAMSQPKPAPSADRPAAPNAPAVAGPRIGRNDPCPCGSGKKYKRCCGA